MIESIHMYLGKNSEKFRIKCTRIVGFGHRYKDTTVTCILVKAHGTVVVIKSFDWLAVSARRADQIIQMIMSSFRHTVAIKQRMMIPSPWRRMMAIRKEGE